jgi:hypothetical protein
VARPVSLAPDVGVPMPRRRKHLEWRSYDDLPTEAGVYLDPSDGRFKRNVRRPLRAAELDGERVAVYEHEPRPVALTLAEARERHWDYFHPADCPCGGSPGTWARQGRKHEREKVEARQSTPRADAQPMREIELKEFRHLGGRWPPERDSSDRLADLADDRWQEERALGLLKAEKKLAHAFGMPTGPINEELRARRAELKKLVKAKISLEKGSRGPLPGRPQGTGLFRNAAEFQAAVIEAGRALRRQGRAVTQENVAAVFSQQPWYRTHGHDYFDTRRCDGRRIREWCDSFERPWVELRRKAESLSLD